MYSSCLFDSSNLVFHARYFHTLSTDLEIKLDRQVSQLNAPGICSRLTCQIEDNNIDIDSVKLNLVTAAGTGRNLIKVTKAKPNTEVSRMDMTGNGTLSSTSATLLLDLMNEETCNSGYFMCETFYKTASGKKRRQFAAAGPNQSPSIAELNSAASSEARNITEIISEAVSESFTVLMNQAVAALAFVNTSSRVSTLEDLVFNRISALENVGEGNDTKALLELEKRIAVIETASSTSKGDEVRLATNYHRVFIYWGRNKWSLDKCILLVFSAKITYNYSIVS